MFDSVEFKPNLQQLQETTRILRLAVRLVWRSSPRLLVGFIMLMLLQALLVPLQLALTRAVIDRAAFDLGLLEYLDSAAALLPLLVWIGLAAAVLALGQFIQPFSSTFQGLAADRLTGYVTEQVIRAANRLQGLARFEDPAFADDLQRARKRASRGALDLTLYVGRAAIELFTAGSLALVLFALHPLVPFLLILATLPQMKRQWEYSERTISHLYIQTPETRRLEYSREVLLTPDAAKDVHLYGMGPFFRQRYDSIFANTTESLNRMRRPLAVKVALAAVLATAASSAVYVYVVWMILQGERTVGDLALYGGAATVLQVNLIALGTEVGLLPLVLGFLPSLFRILDAPPDLTQSGMSFDRTGTPPAGPPPAEAAKGAHPLRFQSIAFENVSFTYPGCADQVLCDLSFTMDHNECVALVGRNGAGKTTIVKLLLRLYDPTSGSILLNGVDLREYDLNGLRRQMGVIFQDFVRYELTAAENIGMGQIDLLHDATRLYSAAERAGAAEQLCRLPDGLDTQLGREFGGRELSDGEWQKLALSRAYLRDAQLLVLDEPTASLDVQTEYEIYTRFHELTRDRITLLISHRFSTVRMADRILYLADGRIQEAGNHAELIDLSGEYSRLYSLQAAQYLDRN
ncbi:MAG: ABC transporter ATP-binding protein [Caldilineaceae bacterium SB0661_bin_32]|uniref:ABC transporter ATP-binding protein n=1 Tax=Caldilineaceae bacterium SB0661_bin_32 TaxID=2605255 RepID=A0A6B1D7K3_9CHLR|nr:ABC transporter ATP-binding protein [Caldilineaceae bacterium SB0661_bin_32]